MGEVGSGGKNGVVLIAGLGKGRESEPGLASQGERSSSGKSVSSGLCRWCPNERAGDKQSCFDEARVAEDAVNGVSSILDAFCHFMGLRGVGFVR